MSIGSIGSGPSFWQQDQSFWQQARQGDNAAAAANAVNNAISSAETNLGKGLASIANAVALKRVNSQITSIVEQVLHPGSSTSSSGSSTTSNANASATGSTTPTPATGTGKVVLTTSTPLSTLGILPGGTITIGAGKNTTIYTSSGTDTIADLINTINVDLPTNAGVTATLNVRGQLVLTSRDDKNAIFIGGSGTDAAAIGFGVGNNTFLPKAASSSSSASSAPSSTTASSASSAKSTAASAPKRPQSFTTLSSVTASDAASLLSDSGAGGTLVDMLA